MEGHISTLHIDGPIFRTADNTPWRLKGVSAFKLLRLIADGEDVTPFTSYFRERGANTLRVWPYVPWPGNGWVSPTNDEIIQGIRFLRSEGFYTYLTLLTSDEESYIPWAKRLVDALAQAQFDRLLLEAGNEPRINKTINVHALKGVLDASPYLYTSGEYDDTAVWFGRMMDAHTPRDNEWCRKCHDLLEYYQGGGPSYQTEPATRTANFAGEPMRADQAGFNAEDALGYFAGCALLGAGGIVHYEGGKYGRLPDANEAHFIDGAFHGLTAFPDDVWYAGPYERIDEHGATLRTYKRGSYIVRIRPVNGPIIGGAVAAARGSVMRHEFHTRFALSDTDEQRIMEGLRTAGVPSYIQLGQVDGDDPMHWFIECVPPPDVVVPQVVSRALGERERKDHRR